MTTSVTTSTGRAPTPKPWQHASGPERRQRLAATIDAGAFLIVDGGADYAATVSAGASETVSAGSATGDQIYGVATVDAGAALTGETVQNGGTLFISSGAVDLASAVLADGFGWFGERRSDLRHPAGQWRPRRLSPARPCRMAATLVLGGAATASNTVLNGGGTVELASPTATLAGSLTFRDGGNTLDIAAVASGGDGDQAVISGFSSADKIVISGIGAGATLSFSTSGGNEVVTVSGGSGAETLHICRHIDLYQQHAVARDLRRSAVDLETSFAASDFNIQPYNASTASTISAGPLALFAVPVDEIAPTQMNEGFTEVDAKAAGFDLFTTTAALESRSDRRYRAGRDRTGRSALSPRRASHLHRLDRLDLGRRPTRRSMSMSSPITRRIRRPSSSRRCRPTIGCCR